MINFKLGNEIWKVNWSTWHERGTEKKIWVPDSNRAHDLLNTMLVLYPLSYENSWKHLTDFICDLALHQSLVAQWKKAPSRFSGGHEIVSCRGLRIFLCSTLVPCWSVHFSQALGSFTLKYSLIWRESLAALTCKIPENGKQILLQLRVFF